MQRFPNLAIAPLVGVGFSKLNWRADEIISDCRNIAYLAGAMSLSASDASWVIWFHCWSAINLRSAIQDPPTAAT
jgi:hypothetical protein